MKDLSLIIKTGVLMHLGPNHSNPQNTDTCLNTLSRSKTPKTNLLPLEANLLLYIPVKTPLCLTVTNKDKEPEYSISTITDIADISAKLATKTTKAKPIIAANPS